MCTDHVPFPISNIESVTENKSLPVKLTLINLNLLSGTITCEVGELWSISGHVNPILMQQ